MRQAKAWAPHLAATSRFIESGIAPLPSRRTVAILGPGPLFDVPLEALAESFGTVILTDRAHPRNGCPATLIADTGYRLLDRAGAERGRFDLLFGRAMPPGDACWDWEVAPFGEEARHTRRVHSVMAWHDWRKAAGAA